jgi:hypothetical protein
VIGHFFVLGFIYRSTTRRAPCRGAGRLARVPLAIGGSKLHRPPPGGVAWRNPRPVGVSARGAVRVATRLRDRPAQPARCVVAGADRLVTGGVGGAGEGRGSTGRRLMQAKFLCTVHPQGQSPDHRRDLG